MNRDFSASTPLPPLNFSRALRQTGIALLLCTAVVLVCYFFVDRQVATYVHDHHLNRFERVKELTFIPPWMQTLSPAVLALSFVWLAFRPLPRCLQAFFIACLSLIIADQFRTSLGDLFGRYWPETWINNNPSWIGNGTYGFHPFQHGDDIGSFPSGHATRVLGFFSVFWIALPRARMLYALLSLPLLVALIMMNYHFVGDVIAGSFLGAIVGSYCSLLANLTKRPIDLSRPS